MSAYRLIEGGVRRLSDNADIPDNMDNRDWVAFQDWLAVPGNTPEPYVPVPHVPHDALTQAEIAQVRALLRGT